MPFNVERWILLPGDVVTVSTSIGYSPAVDIVIVCFKGIAHILSIGREQRAEERTLLITEEKDDDRKRIREEKARLARLTAIQVR